MGWEGNDKLVVTYKEDYPSLRRLMGWEGNARLVVVTYKEDTGSCSKNVHEVVSQHLHQRLCATLEQNKVRTFHASPHALWRSPPCSPKLHRQLSQAPPTRCKAIIGLVSCFLKCPVHSDAAMLTFTVKCKAFSACNSLESNHRLMPQPNFVSYRCDGVS